MRYLISFLGLVVIAGVGYFAVAKYVEVAHGQGLAPASKPDISADGAQVLALLGKLKKITLDGKIFESKAFASLQDWSVNIEPQEVGRPNPFLPVAGTAPSEATTTKVDLPRATR